MSLLLILLLSLCEYPLSPDNAYAGEPIISLEYRTVEVKSYLNEDRNKVFVEVSLPRSFGVGFEIFDENGKIQHLWNDQDLNAGKHKLVLALPDLLPGRYMLHIKVDDQLYKHLLYLP